MANDGCVPIPCRHPTNDLSLVGSRSLPKCRAQKTWVTQLDHGNSSQTSTTQLQLLSGALLLSGKSRLTVSGSLLLTWVFHMRNLKSPSVNGNHQRPLPLIRLRLLM